MYKVTAPFLSSILFTKLIALQREMRSTIKSRFENTAVTKIGRQTGDMLVSEELNWIC